MAKQRYSFKANIRLKDIIGQGLINNSNIAIIELIKNARDANSKSVNVLFEKANTRSPKSRIVVQDFGTGMSLDDVLHKWLNIAYSEKRNQSKKGDSFFAGDKGIGRFSCDRLGKTLNLYTRKGRGALVHLHVDWKKFEVDDPEKEISSVELTPEEITDEVFQNKTGLPAFKTGTCLVIEDLREVWGRAEMDKLLKELERFIIDPHKEFQVTLRSPDYLNQNGKPVFDGVIENKLLSKLDDKTIAVHSSISADGKTIKTALHHYGAEILSFEQDNPYSQLRNIQAHIHYLSQAGKVSFKAITGYNSGDYSSIMLFLNGFRVMPYGEPKDDWLQLNQRKTQGTMRFLGTRELFGIIEIYDNQRTFLPVSSREGLENNLAFKQLTDNDSLEKITAYLPGVLRILEKYVVEGIDWDRASPRNDDFSFDDVMNSIKSVMESQTKGGKVKNVKIDQKKIRAIAAEKINEYESFVDDLKKRVSDKPAYELTPAEKRDIKKYVERHDNRISHIKETSQQYKKEATVEKKRRLFAESHLTTDTQRVSNMQHLIGLWGETIQTDFETILKAVSSGKAVSTESLINTIKKSYFAITKINKLSRIITKANFDMMSDSIKHDIFSYIEQYIEEIEELGDSWKIKISYSNPKKIALPLNMSPLEVGMMIDNIISNAVKAEAKKLDVSVGEDKKFYFIDFTDNGKGINPKYKPEDYFESGISTTKGSGIGLHHVRTIVSELDAEVLLAANDGQGAFIRIRWEK